MTLEDCKKCDYHRHYESGAVQCGYDSNLVVMATVFSPAPSCNILLSCPKER